MRPEDEALFLEYILVFIGSVSGHQKLFNISLKLLLYKPSLRDQAVYILADIDP